MKTNYVYPGCFTPPTYGHFRIVERAAEIFSTITIVCSTNKEKDGTRWYSEDECRDMWRHYSLPENVEVKTFAEFQQQDKDFNSIIMIRGVRDENDLENEKRVMKLNKEMFGIDKLFYILAEDGFVNISASRVRKAAQEFDFQTLSQCVPPAIITMLLKRVLAAENLYMVVGRPGAGKSTFLGMLNGIDPRNIHINTDSFSAIIKPLIEEKFGQAANVVDLAIRRDQEMTSFIAPIWFGLLARTMQGVPKNANVFLEIPYGLKPGKDLYKYVGADVIYIGCEDQSQNLERINKRGDIHHACFINEIPDVEQSFVIARDNGLNLVSIDTTGDVNDLSKRAKEFLQNIKSQKEASS